eukprot:13258105-Alexandrium_andersonii.AAC.1
MQPWGFRRIRALGRCFLPYGLPRDRGPVRADCWPLLGLSSGRACRSPTTEKVPPARSSAASAPARELSLIHI